MRKLLLLSLLVAGTANASTVVYTCNSYELYQGNDSGQYHKVNESVDKANRFTITVTEPVIEVQVNNTDMSIVQFWKDYNVYRNDNGLIEQAGSDFTMKTAIPDPTGTAYIPVKIVYHCK